MNHTNNANQYVRPADKWPDHHKPGLIEQLTQLCAITWDGDVCNKAIRDFAVNQGWAARGGGFNIITPSGIRWLLDNDVLVK